MTSTIFRNTFLVGAIVLVLCAALFFGLQYTQNREETYTLLQQETAYAEQGLMLSGETYLSRLAGTDRVTWIDADGTVRYDSEFALPIANQGNCPEVVDALANGEGHGIREPVDGGETTMYYAKRCQDGTILRMSRPMSAVRSALLTVSPVLWIFVLVLIISGVLAFRVASQIVQPINSLDLDDPDPAVYPELTPLIERIQEQKLTIQEEVSQREQMRREFSANVSHELKTPLTSISGFAELMAEGVVPPEKAREFSGDIYKESQRMITLVDDIIKLSKLDEGGGLPEWESVDLYELSENVLDSLHHAAERQAVTMTLTGEHLCVRGVWQLLSEMVYNLCDNAIKYNRPGGTVTISLEKADPGICLTVSDTGIGIPAEHQKRVFERFYRVDKSHSKEIGGTGLGLSIVKHGAAFHGAQVALSSKPDAGTAITLTFPEPEA